MEQIDINSCKLDFVAVFYAWKHIAWEPLVMNFKAVPSPTLRCLKDQRLWAWGWGPCLGAVSTYPEGEGGAGPQLPGSQGHLRQE